METDIKYTYKDNTIHIYGDFKLSNVNDAMDLIFSVTYEYECNNVILNSDNLDKSFFDLKTKFAGELLQKLVNYNCRIAIVGEFESYNSKALNDFIFECNRKENVGSQIFFLNNVGEAISRLSGTSK